MLTLLLLHVPSIATVAGQPIMNHTTPLEVAAGMTVCLQQSRRGVYWTAGTVQQADLYENDWRFARVDRESPSDKGIQAAADPLSPPITVVLSDDVGPAYATVEYRRELSRYILACLAAAYPGGEVR